MGTYFNPPEELPKVARRLTGFVYDALVAQLQDGEKLFGHYQRPLFQNAVWLHSEEEYQVFEDQVQNGDILPLGYYAMPADVFEARFGRGA